MLNNLIFSAIPHTEPWGLNTILVMIICNSVALAIVAVRSWRSRSTSPNEMPTGLGKFDLATLIAAMSFGHILGVGFSLGLTNLGII